MRKIVFLTAVMTMVLSTSLVEGTGTDLTGNWVLTGRIPSSGVPIPNISLIISQTGNDLAVTWNFADQEKITESHYTLDGAENVNTEPNAAGPVTIRSTSNWNNSTLVLEGLSTFEDAGKKVTNKWKSEYQVSENGAVLTVSRTIQTPFGDVIEYNEFSRK